MRGSTASGGSERITARGLASTPTSAPLLVTTLADGPVELQVEVVDVDGKRVADEKITHGDWEFTESDRSDLLWWTKPVIDGLEPGRRYEVTLVDFDGEVRARCAVATAPPKTADSLTVAFGSCFDGRGPHRSVLGSAYTQVLQDLEPARDENEPVYHLWLGDQVYVDAPWKETTTTGQARELIYDRYIESWGVDAGSSFAHLMTESSNWYLPDDHEFWNGYPHPSWLTLFRHAAVRMVRQAVRYRRKLDPPHPHAQGPWGRAAGEAYAIFTTDQVFGEFAESVSPEAVQYIESEAALVALVDTRWNRTIRKTGPRAGFMKEAELDGLIERLQNHDGLVALALAKPLIGFPPHRGLTRRKIEYGAEDYARQYTRLLRAIQDRFESTPARPTLVLAGDVHGHSIHVAEGLGMLEVVSSPMSLLDALDQNGTVGRVRSAVGRAKEAARSTLRFVKRLVSAGEDRARGRTPFDPATTYPAFTDGDRWEPRSAVEAMPAQANRSGMAALRITRGDEGCVVEIVHRYKPEHGSTPLEGRRHRFQWDGSGWSPLG